MHTLQELIDLLTFNGLTYKDLQITGLLILQEQSDLRTFNGLVWQLILFTIRTFWLHTSQELMNLPAYNGLMCWLTIPALQILYLLKIVEQTGLLTVSLPTLLTLQASFLLTLVEHIGLTDLH